jgi:predicted Rossmann fold flavoprotein
MYIDLKPAMDRDMLDARLLKDFKKYANKDFKNSLGDLLPIKMIDVVVERSGIDPYKKVNSVTREERQRLIDVLKEFRLTFVGLRGYDEAIITRGGVSVKEVNPSTMESKLVGGVYFAGELLDIDALTGGFNLQVAWSTGYLAGLSASESLQ